MNQVTQIPNSIDIYISGEEGSVGQIVPHVHLAWQWPRRYKVVAFRGFREESYLVASDVSLETAERVATNFFKREENILSLRDCLSA